MRRRGFSYKMVLREVLFALALALTTYDALQNSPPKVSRTPTPVPFFGQDSVVTDWYKGQWTPAMAKMISSEVSFIMYYAPWDAESQHVKYEFEKAARILFKQVHFSALNCWNPNGECRLVNAKISTWPILIAYVSHPKRVIVYMGPKDTLSMVKFVRRVIQPLTRIDKERDLDELLVGCDTVILGFVPFTESSSLYNIFYGAALKSLEYDPFDGICFAVVTSIQLTQEMGVSYIPSARIVQWNQTLDYPNDLDFNDENIIHWVYKNVYNQMTWYMTRWKKSFSLQNIFQQGPVLILFTPHNHYYERTPLYDLLREVVMEYNDCVSADISFKVHLSQLEREKYFEMEKNKTIECSMIQIDKVPQTIIFKPIQTSAVTSPTKTLWTNKTYCKSDSEMSKLQLTLNRKSQFYLTLGTSSDLLPLADGCCYKNDEGTCYPHEKPEDVLEKPPAKLVKDTKQKSFKTSMLDGSDDPWSPLFVQKRLLREKCIMQKLGNIIYHQVFPEVQETTFNIQGLGCKVNNTLTFIAIDSLSDYHFAESLGIDILNMPDKTTVVILDNKHETQYKLEKKIGAHTLREFLYDYHKYNLNRHLRTKVNGGILTPISGTNVNYQESYDNYSKSCQSLELQGKEVCLYELNTNVFQSFIMQRKAILVAFCSRGSGPCGGLLTLTLMSMANILKGLGNKLQIGRIDASINDLPWQYTVSKYPTLVFFPVERKDASRSYPENQPITVEGVMAFVLAGLDPPLRLHAQLLLCNRTQGEYRMKECIMKVRYGVGNLISCTLKSWRRVSNATAKGFLLRRLNILRNIAIHMGALNTMKIPSTNPVLVSIIQNLQSLDKLWSLESQSHNIL